MVSVSLAERRSRLAAATVAAAAVTPTPPGGVGGFGRLAKVKKKRRHFKPSTRKRVEGCRCVNPRL